MCGAFNRFFFLRWPKGYQWEQETRIFVEAISFWEQFLLYVCVCTRSRARVCV